MAAREGDEPSGGNVGGLAAFIRKERQTILAHWQTLVRQIPSARKLDRPELLDYVPDLLERIADLTEDIGSGGAPDLPRKAAERHALDRLDEGFDLTEVVLEYSMLRDCILELWEARKITPDVRGGITVLNRAIDRAVAASVERYTHARDRTLQALDRISAAALESRTLDELLEKLLQVFVETTAAVDTAVILLREENVLRARAAVGLEEEVKHGFTISIGEGFAGTIAAERRPKLLHTAASDALVKNAFIRAKGVRALYGVPLVEAGNVIGVAHIGSLSAHEFSEQDKRLVLAMANRATSAIFQHLLRDEAEKRARELAAEVQRRRELEVVVSVHPDFMYLLDKDHRFTYANPALLAYWGKRLDEVIGKNFAELDYPAELVELHRAELDDVLRGQTVKGDNAHTSRSGQAGYFEYIFVPVHAPDGSVRAIAGVTRDISERKRAEQEQRFLKDATAALASSLDYRETLASICKLAVPGLADWCGVEIVMNGRRAEQLAVEHVDPSKVELVRELRRRYPPNPEAPRGVPHVLRTGQAEVYEEIPDQWLVEGAVDAEHLEIIRGLGLKSAMVVPLSARGRTLGAISFVSAESARRYTRHDLEIAQELAFRAGVALDNARLFHEVRDAVRSREEILAIVSHDLRNPLGTIGLATALLVARAIANDPQARRQLETIQRSTSHMERLIGDLLDMASIRAGRLAIEKQVHEAQTLVAEAIDVNHPPAIKKGIRIRWECDVEGIRLLCDRERVMQVFANLLGNAIKFCQRGDAVTISAKLERRRVWIAVSDTGPGMTEDELAHAFEPFWSTHIHAKKGTGLGLFIAKGIVEAHGGELWAESKPGAGSTFHFTLPVA